MTAPDDAMMAPVRAVAGFMATLDDARLADCFADDVVIVENFAPYVFRGSHAVARWKEGFREHAVSLSALDVTFGPAQDFDSDGVTAYFVLPTMWKGAANGHAFEEHGGWAFVLKRADTRWKLTAYAWAVTGVRRV
ncbi:MAG: nuclear transport factor 2 family protein [Rhizomicrobium sp.]